MIQTKSFLEFINNSHLVEQFKQLLVPFHKYLVKKEWLDLMETPDNCTDWYYNDLVLEANQRTNITFISYVIVDNNLVWFWLWYSWNLKDRSIDYKDYKYTKILELFILEQYRGKKFWDLIVSTIESLSKKEGVSKVFLDVLTNNPSIEFYKKKNYSSWEQVMVKTI